MTLIKYIIIYENQQVIFIAHPRISRMSLSGLMEMIEVKQPRIPYEVVKFFNNPGGHSLILRGHAGSGKTTFALQTIEDLSNLERSYYLSTRVSDTSLYSQFPWLKDLPENMVIKEEDHTERARTRLKALQGFKNELVQIPEGEITISLGKELKEIERIYDSVERNLPDKSLVVIDSIDAMAEKYELSCAKLISTIQKDLVEDLGANVLFVLESPEPHLDYLGDGVIILTSTLYNRRRIRELDILKLRGCEIRQPKYLFTLKGGKIQCFSNGMEGDVAIKKWVSIEDRNGRISTGIADLDRLLKGGMEKGSINLIELGEGIPNYIIRTIEYSLVANFISLDRGVLWVPLRKANPDSVREEIARYIGEDRFDRFVKIPVPPSMLVEMDRKHIMTVEGRDASADFKWRNIEYSLEGTKHPLLSLIGFDTLESIYRGDIMDQLMEYLSTLKSKEGIFVGITSPASRSVLRLADLATVHIRVERIGGTVIFYGENPFTCCNAVTFDCREKGSNMALIEII